MRCRDVAYRVRNNGPEIIWFPAFFVGNCCHAELAPIAIGTASLPNGKDSDFRQNDVYCHAEFISASLPIT